VVVTVNAGMRGSYTDATINRRNIADAITIADPDEVPLLKLVGSASAAKVAGVTQINNTKLEWIEDHYRPVKQTQTGSTEWTNSTTATQITVAEGAIYEKGMVIKASDGDELMWVAATPLGGAVQMTVTRGIGATTKTTHSSTCDIEIVGIAMVEGDDPPAGVHIVPVVPYNYTQIFEAGVRLTGTEEEIAKYGYANAYNYRRTNVQRELMIQLERACFVGRRAVGTATTPRLMGGLPVFITADTAMAGAPLTRKALEDKVQASFELVGAAFMPDTILCNAWAKRKITSFYDGQVRTERTDRTGGTTITRIDTEFGPLDVSMNRWCPKDKLYIVRRSFIGVGPLGSRSFKYEELAKTGDRRQGHIFGEYTMVVKNPDAHGSISGFDTTK
jgi:hypothetical protein